LQRFHKREAHEMLAWKVTPAKDSALASAGAEYRLANGITLLAKFDGEFAAALLDLRRHRNDQIRMVGWPADPAREADATPAANRANSHKPTIGKARGLRRL
jgi:hypothetical protein